ncbi:hypothetical protein V6N13_126144 [Hibiscus sabdariffa]
MGFLCLLTTTEKLLHRLLLLFHFTTLLNCLEKLGWACKLCILKNMMGLYIIPWGSWHQYHHTLGGLPLDLSPPFMENLVAS